MTTTILINDLCGGLVAFATGSYFRLPLPLTALLGGLLGFCFAHLSGG